MRTFFLVLITGLSGIASFSQAPASAGEIMREATELAAKENKNVFVMFTASWCGWCKKMDASIADSSCRDFFSNSYVIRHMVVDETPSKLSLENPGAKEFRARYFGDRQGIPYWMIFDKNGNILLDSKIRQDGEGLEKGTNTGCPATKEEVEHFIKALNKTSSLTKDQLEIIRKRFRRNEL